jgi:NADH-quinone oxidoreductase subunit N
MTQDLIQLSLILPEVILALGAMALLLFGVYVGERSSAAITLGSVLVIAAAALAAAFSGEDATTLGGAFIVDGLPGS